MRNRRRHVYNFVGSSLDSIARTANRNSFLKRLGLDRRHIVFGLIVLFLCSISTSVYIYHKHWTITTTSPGGKAQRERTISIRTNNPDNPVAAMSEEIRQNILDTPMAEATTQQSAARSAASGGTTASRTSPQNNAPVDNQ